MAILLSDHVRCICVNLACFVVVVIAVIVLVSSLQIKRNHT